MKYGLHFWPGTMLAGDADLQRLGRRYSEQFLDPTGDLSSAAGFRPSCEGWGWGWGSAGLGWVGLDTPFARFSNLFRTRQGLAWRCIPFHHPTQAQLVAAQQAIAIGLALLWSNRIEVLTHTQGSFQPLTCCFQDLEKAATPLF